MKGCRTISHDLFLLIRSMSISDSGLPEGISASKLAVSFPMIPVFSYPMKYQVVIESAASAVVKTTYLIKEFSYEFLGISFDPVKGSAKKRNANGKYTFTSSTMAPPFARDDIRRYRIIRQKFHGEDNINVTVEAASLQEACDK